MLLDRLVGICTLIAVMKVQQLQNQKLKDKHEFVIITHTPICRQSVKHERIRNIPATVIASVE